MSVSASKAHNSIPLVTKPRHAKPYSALGTHINERHAGLHRRSPPCASKTTLCAGYFHDFAAPLRPHWDSHPARLSISYTPAQRLKLSCTAIRPSTPGSTHAQQTHTLRRSETPQPVTSKLCRNKRNIIRQRRTIGAFTVSCARLRATRAFLLASGEKVHRLLCATTL